MTIHIGTGGWGYRSWKNLFYLKGVNQPDWLSYYAKTFNTVEVDNTSYKAPRANVINTWAADTPKNFIFSVKATRYITHWKKLKNCKASLASFFNGIKGLKGKCGPIIFELGDKFGKNLETLQNFLKLLPSNHRYCFDFRNESWWSDDVIALLKKNRIAFCVYNLNRVTSPRIVTTDFIYIRLYGPTAPYVSKYGDAALRDWAKWIKAQKQDAYIYFENTKKSDYAVQNAMTLAKFMNK